MTFSDLLQPISHKLEALKIKQTARILCVSIAEQQLVLIENGIERRRFAVSTSAQPPSCAENSYGTPTGLHRITAKIGDNAPLGEVFKARESIGKRYWELSEEERKPNLVTTRILWLEGLEAGHNQGDGCDSYQRYIYIHGTNHEDAIGKPASGGCVLLRNEEMIELFNLVEKGDLTLIYS